MHSPASINNIPIGIPDTRWKLICETHPETAPYLNETIETIEDPEFVYEGTGDKLIAVKKIDQMKYLSVVYNEKIKELITVYICRNLMQFDELKILWKKNI